MSDESKPLTVGEERVRATFNPSEDPNVTQLKTITANLIDFVEGMKERDPRLAALAQTAFEQGAMWAVKLATTSAPK